MNREKIEFRVWDKERRKMIYSSDEVYDGLPVLGLNGQLSVTRFDREKDKLISKKNEVGLHSWIDYSEWYGIDYMKPMLSIETKDRKGKTIYDGDILDKIGVYKNARVEIDLWNGVTIYGNDWFCYDFKMTDFLKAKVIGNIYEDIHLLNKQEEKK